jgi:hypothetical protein
MSSSVMQILRASPGAPLTDDRLLADCISQCAECAQSCVACADACLGETQLDPLRRCIRLNLDCADACEVAARMLLRPHEPDLDVLRRQLEVASLSCRACSDECGKHAGQHEHCRVCRDICVRCAEACTRVREALERLPSGATTRH